MSEPESLATIEGLDEHVRRHSYDRLLMLSDGIFAIATTLAALDVRIPTHADSFRALLVGSQRSLIAYGLSFLVTGVFWLNHRNLFARLRRVDTALTAMTLAMLGLIALIPATIRTLYLEEGGHSGLRLYGLTMCTCGIVSTAMWCYASFRPGLMHASIDRRERWTRILATIGLPICCLPVVVMPDGNFVGAMLPLLVAMVLVRRVVLPKLMPRTAG
ncbi:MAG TPA: TMEM175 family protein [Allosphingosinicella sp.]|nr:TMEM175 family protein [Allosphingosinicella sp.]